MSLSLLSFQSTPSEQFVERKNLLLVIFATVLIALTAGAMNGGTALGTSAFDTLITYLKTNWLQSTFIIFLCLFALIATLWQLVHGKGMGNLSTLILILVVGVSGYSIVTTAASATRGEVPLAPRN